MGRVGPTDTAIFDTNNGGNALSMLSAEWVAKRIVDGLRKDETVIESSFEGR